MGNSSCALDILNKEEANDIKEVKEDHSLANIVAFSSSRKQMHAPSKEGLQVDEDGREIDRRTKIVYSDESFHKISYFMLCQITAKCPGGKKGVGTCFAVYNQSTKFFLTCAHNLGDVGAKTGRVVSYTNIYIYKARQGEGESKAIRIFQGDCSRLSIHPKYDGQADCGFDIGIIPASQITKTNKNSKVWIKPMISRNSWEDVVWQAVKAKKIKKGMSMELAGFPGEKDGWPHTHEGEIVDVTKTKLGGYVLWYTADATPGNSGSCVMITDPGFVKSISKTHKKIIVGVHTGWCKIDRLNYGTLLTPSIGKWIKGR